MDEIAPPKYRIDPNFAVPEPTGADIFSFSEWEGFDFRVAADRMRTLMKEAGAAQIRVTIVNDEFPRPPYPEGVYWEGWTDPKARQLPFGEARPDDGTLSPPLMAGDHPHE